MAEYNPDEARKILEGSLEKRIIAYADLKCGKGAEVAAELRKGNYRENYDEDPIQTLDKVCGKPEIIDAEFESIDAVVEYQPKPSALKVAAKGTLNLARKMHFHQWYYPFVGALPAKYQHKIAARFRDNAASYTVANGSLDLLMGISGVVYSLIAFSGNYQPNIIPVICLGSIAYAVNGFCRLADGIKSRDVLGSPSATIPFYLTLGAILAGKKIRESVKDSYSSAYQDERKRIEVQKNLRLEEQNVIDIQTEEDVLEAAEEELQEKIESKIKSTNSLTII
ncbi:MAG: hypothetical protein AABW53_02570 [Nanoarchaeota archaeon]